MQSRGQAAIEFIMLVLIIVIYLMTITRPLVDDSKNLTMDVSTIVRADSESKRLVNSITEISMLGEDSKRTLRLFVPANATIYCWQDKIGFDVNLNTTPYPVINVSGGACTKESCCQLGRCDKNFSLPPNVVVDCRNDSLRGPTNEVVIINNGELGGNIQITVIS